VIGCSEFFSSMVCENTGWVNKLEMVITRPFSDVIESLEGIHSLSPYVAVVAGASYYVE